MKKSYLIALGIAVVAGLWMASGTMDQNGDDQTETGKDVQPKATQSLNTVNTVQTRTLTAEKHTRKIIINGRTAASRTARISAEIQGQINDIRTDDGSRMKKGDVIATIKIDDRKVALESARNRVKQFELEYKTARNLVERGFSTEVQVATRKAELEDAKAALRRAEIALQNTKIRAPFDGILEQRNVEEGDYVQIGAEIALFIDLDPVYVVGFVAEQRIQDIETGQPGVAILPDGSRHE
jgi:multidrug efflux system membrane fusion protein